MRIIAGAAKGRRLAVARSGTRPMTGRARESIFSILANRLQDARVLDLFAGSGSLGLEALSRGAHRAVFVERGRAASTILRENVERVGLGGDVHVRDVSSFLNALDEEFDIVFVDPPYADDDTGVTSILALLESVLSEHGVIVLHRQAASAIDPPEFLRRRDERRYGDAVVTIMERAQE